jgi:hypothetical protein
MEALRLLLSLLNPPRSMQERDGPGYGSSGGKGAGT